MRQRSKKAKVQSEPVAKVSRQGNRMPKTVTTGRGTVVSHTETYGVNVTGSNPFEVFATWALNPGLSNYSKGSPLGSWLPQIAGNFDNYEIESLRFKFRTACSTLTTGLAVFGFEPNPEGTVPTTYQEIRNMYSADGSVHANLVFDVSSRVRKKLLVRKGNVVNLPSYDAGKVYFATIGVTDSALIGFVDVEYRVRLSNPQSSTTTTSLPPTVIPPATMWYINNDYSSMGATNAAEASDVISAVTLNGSTTVGTGGAPLFEAIAHTYPAQQIDFPGIRYKWPARTGHQVFSCKQSGRYEMRMALKIGYEDLKMFAMNWFRWDTTSNTFVIATRKVYTTLTGDATVSLNNPHYTHRGFTGVATGDPNPGTEVWPIISFEIDAEAGQRFLFAIGVVTYNSVSTTTANYQGYSNLGYSAISARYLGALV